LVIQIGGQVFALIAVDRTLVAAPPRSFAMLQGVFRYDSSLFWSTVPPLTSCCSSSHWLRTGRPGAENFYLTLTLFVVITLVSILYLQPTFDAIKAIGYRDEIDPTLRSRAAKWHAAEWAVWCLALVGGFALLLALIRPATTAEPIEGNLLESAA
jgi:hypothetical protein